MGKKVLGLDLGPNSIGWALVDVGDSKSEASLIDMGVRVFAEGVDAFDSAKEVSRNEGRRTARAMRRQTKRRTLRRRRLTEALVSAGLWPSDPAEQNELLQRDPYELRSRAVDPAGELSPYELGRVFLSLSRRRGFQSNKKTDKGKEAGDLLQEISENEKEREASGAPTLGAWLHQKSIAFDHRHRVPNDHVRRRHLSRKEYLDEFDQVWETQKAKHPQLLTDRLRYGMAGENRYPVVPTARPKPGDRLLDLFGLHGLIFFQRKMYWRTSVIGRCELEPKQKRAPIADRRVQLFRILQEVNNLSYIDPNTKETTLLDDGQRKRLIAKLMMKEKMPFDDIRKALGKLDGVRFNLEKGERSNLKGHRTDSTIAQKKYFGPDWYDLEEGVRTEVVEALLDPNLDEFQFAEKASNTWKFSPQQIERLLAVDLPTGYGSLSTKAIEKMLPYLQKGMIYSSSNPENSALGAAGYLRRDQLKRRLFDFLPSPARTKNTPIGNIPNPVVKRTLTEVRKLVNAVVREYGKPSEIHVEMARDLQMGSKKRKKVSSDMRKREAKREEIADRIKEADERPTRENILRYQLWEEQNRMCIYTGRPISQTQLFSEIGGVDIDHILPRSRTLDDSQANKVLCFRDVNAEKGNRTPYEWLADNHPERYESLIARVLSLRKSDFYTSNKTDRFLIRQLKVDDFIARQLVDTAYITRATAEYLRCMFDADHHVLGLKGRLTSELRWRWGLETLLEELPDSPAWAAAKKLRPGVKNRADHRHHAIDALVIALTDRSTLQKLSATLGDRLAAREETQLELPWKGFRQQIKEKVASILVSHRVERKISGKLHEETLYGPTKKPGEWVVRKSIDLLSLSEIPQIRDAVIREAVIRKLAANGIEVGRAKDKDKKLPKKLLCDLMMPSGVRIRKVRIVKKDGTIRQIRSGCLRAYVKTGSMHHLTVFEWGKNGKNERGAVFVSMLEATRRLKSGKTVIERDPPQNHSVIPANARFLFSLSANEAFLAEKNGVQHLYIFSTAPSTRNELRFYSHLDARRVTSSDRDENDKKKIKTFTLRRLVGRKVTVDLLGRVRWAND
jgi:CRISPR-associated endonuclease Csn1